MNKSLIYRTIPFVLILLNLIVKLLNVSTNSINGDEAFSIYHAQMDILSIIKHLSNGNNPPLYELFLHFWIKLFGISEFSVRIPSIITSSLTVLYVYKIGGRFFTFQVGLIAGLLFTFSNLNLSLSHEARVYSFLTFFVTASMYYFLNIVKEPKLFRNYVIPLILNTLIIYSHYLGFLIILVQTLVFLCFKDFRRLAFKNYIIYSLLLIVLYTPNIQILINRFFISSSHGTWISPPNGLKSIYGMLNIFSNKPIVTFTCVLTIITSFFVFIKRKKEPGLKYKIILFSWFAVPFGFMFIVSYWIPMFIDRYMVFISVGYYISIAFLIFSIFKETIYSYILSGLVILLFIITYKTNIDNGRHVKEAVNKVMELKTDEAKVYLCPSCFALNYTYYYNRNIFANADCNYVYTYYSLFDELKKDGIYAVDYADSSFFTSKKVIYLDVAANDAYPNNNILNSLNKNYKLLNTYKYFEVLNVYEFVKK